MTRIENALGPWTVKYRWWIILATVPIIGFSALGVGRLKIVNDTRVFFGEKNPQYQALKAMENMFSKEQNVAFVLAPKDGNIFTRKTLTAIAELTKASWKLPYSIRVASLSNFQHLRSQGDELIVENLIPDPNKLSDKEIEKAKQTALSEVDIVNRLVSPTGHVAGVFVGLILPEGDRSATPEVAAAARKLVKDFKQRYPDIDIYLTGSVLIDQAFAEAGERDLVTIAPIMFLTMALLIGLTLRSLFGTLAAVAIIGLSMLTGLGLTGWLGIPLTAASASAPGLVLTLAVADCVHILSTIFHLIREGAGKREAVARSLQINLQAVFLTSLTTVIGFLSMNFSDSPPFRDFGNIVAIGVTAAFLYSIFLLPAMMAVLPCSAHAKQISHIRVHCDKLATFVIGRKSILLWTMLAVGVVTSLGTFRIELDDNFLTYFDRTFPFRRATDFLIKNLGGWDVIEYPLPSGEPGAIADPQYLTTLDQFARWFRAQPKVKYVHAISDTMKRLNRDMHGGDPNYYRIPETRELAAQYLLFYELSLPFGQDLNTEIDVDRTTTRVMVLLESMSTKELRQTDAAAQQWLKTHAPPQMHISGTGLSLVWAHITYRNIRSMLKGCFGALILISIIMAVALRSLRLGLISLVPNLLPAVMAFGIWGLVRQQVGLALSVIVAMTIGIVVDDTVHFLSKYSRARREQDMDPTQAVRYAFQTVGTAMWVTTVALAAGFLVVAQSHYRMSSDMGWMCALIITLALVMDFLLLPTLLLKLDGKGDKLGVLRTGDNKNT